MNSPKVEVREQRENVYGKPEVTLRCLAMHWTAILQCWFQSHDKSPESFPLNLVTIPNHLVGLMLACLKVHRIASPFDKRDHDSYVDIGNYLDFCHEIDPTLPPEESKIINMSEALEIYKRLETLTKNIADCESSDYKNLTTSDALDILMEHFDSSKQRKKPIKKKSAVKKKPSPPISDNYIDDDCDVW